MLKIINLMLSQTYGYMIQFGVVDAEGCVNFLDSSQTKKGYDSFGDECAEGRYCFALYDDDFWKDLPNGIAHKKRQKNQDENTGDYMKSLGATQIHI